MNNIQIPNQKKYNLNERTFQYSKDVISLCKSIVYNKINSSILTQLIRSGTSIGANYLEANDALGKKDFIMHLRIARKEAKETIYWLSLVEDTNKSFKIAQLIKEAIELRNIISSIINKSK